MNLWDYAELPVGLQTFWTPTVFSKQLINANTALAQSGYCLRMALPKKGSNDPLNLAEMPASDTQLGVLLINDYASRTGVSFTNNKSNSNWALLMSILLDNTVCYMETPSTRYKTKTICTRNLAIANNLSVNPIKNFDLLVAIMRGNVAFLEACRDANPALTEPLNTAIAISQTLSLRRPIPAQLEWLAGTFGADKKRIKVFLEAQAMLNDGIGSCMESKLGYIKLKPTENGFYEMPTRIQGTKYAVDASTILMPLTFMREQARLLSEQLVKGIVLVRFKRDNDVFRDMLSTNNSAVLDKIYDDIEVTQFNSAPSYVEDRGYIRTVDICSSKIGDSVQRAISLARISGYSSIEPNLDNLDAQLGEYGFHSSLATTDLSAVTDAFKSYIDRYGNSLPFLNMIYKGINKGFTGELTTVSQAVIAINEFVDAQNTLTSSFVRTLHVFMLNNPVLFPDYTGKPKSLDEAFLGGGRFRTLGVVK